MLIYFLSNLAMGGSPAAPATAVLALVDPDAGSLIATADDPGEAGVDPDSGSLIIQ